MYKFGCCAYFVQKRVREEEEQGKLNLGGYGFAWKLFCVVSLPVFVLLKNGFHSCDDCILYMKFETTKEKTCVLVVGGRCVCKIKGRVVNKEKDRKTSWITKCFVYCDGLKQKKSCDFALQFSILCTNKICV